MSSGCLWGQAFSLPPGFCPARHTDLQWIASNMESAELVEQRSAGLEKELGLRDLVLAQILYVVGSGWVGTAAKLGSSHIVFWLAAVVLFYVPLAMVVIWLNRWMPLEGGMYQWAKLGFNEFIGFMVAWNLWLYIILFMSTLGVMLSTNLSYAFAAPWMSSSKAFITLVMCVFAIGLVMVNTDGL